MKEIVKLKTAIEALEAQRSILGDEVIETSIKALKEQIDAIQSSVDQGLSKSKPQRKPAERRQLTVLFSDLVGSTSLSEQMDAEEYRLLILSYQKLAEKVIQKYRGHIAQYLGDGLLVYFGYPKGLEDAPKAAIQAGLGILESVLTANAQWKKEGKREIAIRIGIHTGQVVVDDHLAMGDTVNIAARLEGLAPSNGIVISATTHNLVKGWFEAKSQGPKSLKGIQAPMEVFQVLGQSGAQSSIEIARGRGLSPLVGRETELNALIQRWQFSETGKGQFVHIWGEAGIGKSRLVQNIQEQVAQKGNAVILKLRCMDHHRNSAFYPLIDLLENRVLALENEHFHEIKLARLIAWMDSAGIKKDKNLPIIAGYLSIPLNDEIINQFENPLIAASHKRNLFIEILNTLLWNYEKKQPVLVIIEDLHWMDSSTLEWLHQLVEKIETRAIYVLVTSRPHFQVAWPKEKFIHEIHLNPLGADQVEAICYHQTKGKELPAKVLGQIQNKTDGIPLFVEELTRVLIESDIMLEEKSTYRLKGELLDMQIPASLQDSLNARLDKIPYGKDIAQIGSVLGRSFSYQWIQALSPGKSEEIDRKLALLVDSDLLFQKGEGSSALYNFKHALIQDAAYASLLKSTRRRLHKQVVQIAQSEFPHVAVSQPEIVAHHLTEAGMYELAVEQWAEAGKMALARFDNHDAVHRFERALELLAKSESISDPEEKELDILILYNPSVMLSKGYTHPDVEKIGHRILALCAAGSKQKNALQGYYGLVAYYSLRPNFPKTLEILNKGMLLSRELGEDGYTAIFYSVEAEVFNRMGHLKGSVESCRKANAIFDPVRHQEMNRLASGDIGLYYDTSLALSLLLLGHLDQAFKVLEKHDSNFKDPRQDLYSAWRMRLARAMLYSWTGDWQRGAEILEEILPVVEESGEFTLLLYTQVFLYSFQAVYGIEGALEKAVKLVDQLRDAGMLLTQTILLSALTEACLKNDNIDQGMEYCKRGIDLIAQTGEHVFESFLCRQKGLLLLRRDKKEAEAETAFLEAIDVARKQSAKWPELLAVTSLAKLKNKQGYDQDVIESLKQVYNWFTEGIDNPALQEADQILREVSPVQKKGKS